MHVFLTGPVQIGKSTLLRASLDALQPQKLGGFRTVSAQPQADGSRPVVEALGLRIRVEELCERRVEWALVERLELETGHDGETA